MRALVTLTLTLLALVPLPLAAASDDCVAERPDAPVYVWSRFGSPSEYQVWTETNGIPGLQRAPCVDADGRTRASDTQQLGTGEIYPPCSRPPRPIICLF